MSFSHSPSIVKENLILYLDAANPKSYSGTGTTWFDLVGEINGEINGATYDINNKVFNFDGVSDHILVNNFPSVFQNSFSFNGWFYFEEGDARDVLFGSYNELLTKVNFEKHTSNRLRLWWNNGANDIYTPNNVIESGVWTYISMQRNKENATFDFYVNGNLVHQPSVNSSDINNPSSTFRIGKDTRDGTTALNGKCASISICNKALSSLEVLQNYNALKGRFQ